MATVMYSSRDAKNTTVPAFLAKLWALVQDESNNDLIYWDQNGTSFHIHEQGRFAKEVLPYYFKHSNIASFIRQLNMYGFHKVTNIENGALRMEKDDMEFSHPYFLLGSEQMLVHIKRKITKGEEMKTSHEDIGLVLTEVQVLKGKQSSVSGKLASLKKENNCLWREVAQLRQKHQQQQQIVSKLIQFLVSLVGNRRGMTSARKRNLPMIVDTDEAPSGGKVSKYSNQLSIRSPDETPYADQSPETLDTASVPDILTIRDVTDQLSVPPSSVTDQLSTPPSTITAPLSTPTSNVAAYVHDDVDPLSVLSSAEVNTATVGEFPVLPQLLDDALQATRLAIGGATDMLPTTVATSSGNSTFAPEEMSSHIDHLQSELDSVKDYLSTHQYSFDSAVFTELFGPEFPLTFNSDTPADMNLSDLDEANQGNSIVGNELIKYEDEPNLFETLFDTPSLPTPFSTPPHQPASLDTPLDTPPASFDETALYPSSATNTAHYNDMENVD